MTDIARTLLVQLTEAFTRLVSPAVPLELVRQGLIRYSSP